MGASLNDPKVTQQLDKLRESSQQAARELKLDEMQAALDLAGVVDPTPVSDAASALISVARGDWFGAGMSLVSMIPYVGDAVGKTAKGAKLLARMAKLKERIADNVTRGRQIVANALKKDAEAIRAKRAASKAEKIEEGLVNGCPVGGNRFGTQSPKNGWVKGERGHGDWDPKQSGLDPDKVKRIESVTGGKPVKFENGNPDFSDYVMQAKSADGKSVPASVEIKLDRNGAREVDFDAARAAMAEKLGTKEFSEPKGWTWHHKEDGTTMELVPSALHNNVPHSGGVSIAKDPSY
jgi:A nuclease of the HNH/ENDO VII superfamily with conserved WHH